MAEYIELIESLRQHKCTAEEPQSLECEECEYYVITEDKTSFIGYRKTCTQLLMKIAADTIEELTAYCNNQEDTIKELVEELEKKDAAPTIIEAEEGK